MSFVLEVARDLAPSSVSPRFLHIPSCQLRCGIGKTSDLD